MQIKAGAPLITPPGPNGSPTSQTSPNRPRRPRRLLYLALLIVAVPVYVADQLTKAWAVANLEPGQPQSVIGSVLQLNLIRNSGAAFSIATGATWVLTVIACSVVIFIVVIARRLGSRGWALALGLLLAGSLGNLTDRMFRAPGPGRGHVVDFVELPHYPIFNVADSAIVSAAVLIAVLAFRGINIDGTRASSPRHDAAEHDRNETGADRPGSAAAPEVGTSAPEVGTSAPEVGASEPEVGASEPQVGTPEPEGAQQPPQQPAGTDRDV